MEQDYKYVFHYSPGALPNHKNCATAPGLATGLTSDAMAILRAHIFNPNRD
jgi:hypothetical protein